MPHISYTYPYRPEVPVIHQTHCCGIMEIDYLSKGEKPLDVLIAIEQGLIDGPDRDSGRISFCSRSPRFVTFSGVVGARVFNLSHDGRRPDDYGQGFADYLVANKLGTIVETIPQRNWTGNMIKLWVWLPDYEALRAHLDLLNPKEVPIGEDEESL